MQDHYFIQLSLLWLCVQKLGSAKMITFTVTKTENPIVNCFQSLSEFCKIMLIDLTTCLAFTSP